MHTQTKQAKHTGRLAYNHVAKVIVDERGNCLASIHKSAQDEVGKTIVRAVNSHEDLVGALHESVEVLTAIANELDDFKDSARAHSLRVLAAQQQRVVAHATGE